MEYIVSAEHDGLLLRTYLKNVLFLSRSLVSEMKRKQGLSINGEKVTVRYVLKMGDVVCVDFEDDVGSENIEPVNIEIKVLYEDEHIVVVDKPPFMPVHPSHGHRNDTLANALAYIYRDKNFVMRAINRLDRNTSGIVLVAKNRKSAFFLSNQMKERKFGKIYVALTEGIPPDEFFVETYMKRKNESVIERKICFKNEDGAEYSCTEGKTKESFRKSNGDVFSLVELIPHTGRTHQLRVHMAYLGFPIVGDDLYGTDGDRHMLHCRYLSFVHPETREKMEFFSDCCFGKH